MTKYSIRRAVHEAPVRSYCLEVLLRRFGVDLFRGTHLLESAAKRGKIENVRLMLEAGSNVGELFSKPGHNDDKYKRTVLYETVYKHHGEVVHSLLRGADPGKEVAPHGWNTPLELAVGPGYARIAEILQRNAESHWQHFRS